jgi:selenocysteine lyase/cysteine desulfurase
VTKEEYARHFGDLGGYCDFARLGPPSWDVEEISQTLFAAWARGEQDGASLETWVDTARSLAARLTGRPGPEHVVLTPNTSTGLFSVALGLLGRIGPDQEILVSSWEFPANVYPWLRAQALGGPRVRFLRTDHGWVTPRSVAQALSSLVAVLAVSAVDYRTGYRVDLEELREVLGDRLLIVDAVQGFGICPNAWEEADVVAVGGQKWLRAGWGTGFVSLSARALERLGEAGTGWWGVERAQDFDGQVHPPRADALRLSLSAPDAIAAARLARALMLVEQAKEEALAQWVQPTVQALEEVVREAGGTLLTPKDERQRAAILSFVPASSLEHTQRALKRYGVVATCRGGYVRLSPHATTRVEVAQQVQLALREAQDPSPAS